MDTRFPGLDTSFSAGRNGSRLAVRPMIVVGVDGSPASMEAIRWASRRCQMLGAHLQAVIAWTPRAAPAPPLTYGDDPASDARAIAAIALEHALSGRADTARVHVRQGPAVRVLLDAAAEANMLVIGSSEWAVDGSYPHHSICGQVVAHSRCPVVIVRSAHLRTQDGPAGSTALLDSWEYTVWPGNR